jgi:hypothetical protein
MHEGRRGRAAAVALRAARDYRALTFTVSPTVFSIERSVS